MSCIWASSRDWDCGCSSNRSASEVHVNSVRHLHSDVESWFQLCERADEARNGVFGCSVHGRWQ